ncbi:MAG: antibiotic biosynthesis monooxygenase [Geminicoccaceae bacterium]|nr:antibiotic biosynthesis monooxygenase [Geminicoccaceae bacterium]MCS7268122.1 antibiotic biosynthesis monooxygenase [Geminicoccaceae bacterium]MCX7630474.1 antibiotic biosynthesis monooxygenase [Geminicoccaceae bacterium]MDW8125046.1 NAD(P)-dependent oxidoreductase [Geminicoccaceae bacterium]MDW8342042.1 NAD(P)-dependent oxidoreductase [Geminicoccaceae bacterium]
MSEQALVVVAEFKVRPGQMDAFLPLLEQHARNSRAHEPGCLQFDVVRDGTDPDRAFVYEVYRDEAAFEEHKKAPYLAAFRERADPLLLERKVSVHRRVAAPGPGRPRRVLVAAVHLKGRERLLQPLLEAGLELVWNPYDRPLAEEELVRLLPGCVASIAGQEPYTERVFAAAPGLEVVARLGVGWDSVDVAAATRHGVAVAMAFGTNHEAVADHAFALMAALAHAIPRYDRLVRAGEWKLLDHGRLTGTTVGIVGFGRIGRALAKRCQGFAMEVLVSDPYVDAEAVARLGHSVVPLDELFARADFVSLHAPLTPETRRLVDARRLSLMKPSAFLINTARGGLVDEAALVEALRAGRIAGAGLDVMAVEPLPLDSPLRTLPNVVLTPHAAGASTWAIETMAARTVANVLAVLRGQDPGGGLVLNPEVLERRAASRAGAILRG